MMEFLRELHDTGELNTDFRELPMVLPYHVSCQTRAHRMGRPALDVMTLIPGLDIREGQRQAAAGWRAPMATKRKNTTSR